jgi:hypothetical protein
MKAQKLYPQTANGNLSKFEESRLVDKIFSNTKARKMHLFLNHFT